MILPTLLLTFLCSLATSDPIYFDITIHCDLSFSRWCGDLYVLEKDFFVHDVLPQIDFCATEHHKNYTFTVTPGGDFSNEYEFAYVLNHNCTTDGKIRCLKPSSTTDVPVAMEQSVRFDIEAADNGEQFMCSNP
ncbi:DUF870 domain-containing protein [Caenorhabditis elegans]|uniref:Uncharacterized protein n=1 Tax=Caenorhabditis elegans TaxID=6239 RepID=M1Z889_CAEEL|nr:Uncharacterized protein CELE_F47C12.13 [Caenorhabditis elegans]CCU83357.1 Uncharacterized protein CELE_F47C12.13 [Caenorhabditis elegans]|eukprot:NP_001294238.1 Uncharacterized protein CELE_F47C12.13 [Caenorhabditis elegans]